MHEGWREEAKLGINGPIHVEVALMQPKIHGQKRMKDGDSQGEIQGSACAKSKKIYKN
jgi:hypothetical protein